MARTTASTNRTRRTYSDRHEVMNRDRHGTALEAARIICEELVVDYRIAKNKAVQRLGLTAKGALPDNAEVQQAVIDYQRLFGGDGYVERLRRMREIAVRALKLLADFSPRLVGAVVSGAVTQAHRVQLHAFSDKAESIEKLQANRGFAVEQGDRDYRFADGREESIALASFELDGIGVDVAVFGEGDERHAPVNPADGSSYKRLDLAQAEALARAEVRGIAGA
jgi:hypothetical protein